MVAHCWRSGRDAEELAERCRIAGFLGKRMRRLSLGMKQQVTLAAGYLTGAR